MCIIIWVSKEKFEQLEGRIRQHRYNKLMAKLSRFSPRKPSPPEYDQDLVIKVHQNHIPAFERPDSLSLPKYTSYRNNGKRQRVDEEKKVDKVQGAAAV